MTPTLLQAVLRRAARLTDDPTAPGASDADLLRRFADTHDEAAFQTLLDRHGPLAWAVCRQMLAAPIDAEDAFQATCLALVQSAGKLGRVKSVGGWLHGVAVKVCLKVRRSAARRKVREERSAKPEAVAPCPQWEDLHAAVHEEVERLPATLRAAFVLCELEGVRQPDAAAQLGCKLGTLSARLTRARQALLKALTARGLAPTLAVGTVAVGSSKAAVPLVLVEKAILIARGVTDAGFAVPSGVFKLAQSVTEGTLMKTKLLVAAGFAAAGVMLTAAGGWADAQGQPPAREVTRPAKQPGLPEPPAPPKPPKPPRIDNEDHPTAPQLPGPPAPPRPPRAPEPPRFDHETRPAEPPQPPLDPLARPGRQGSPQRVEHQSLDVPGSKDEIKKILREQEMKGWEFAGQAGEGRAAQLVFKRPKGNPQAAEMYRQEAEMYRRGLTPSAPDSRPVPWGLDPMVPPPSREPFPAAPRRGGDSIPPAEPPADVLRPSAPVDSLRRGELIPPAAPYGSGPPMMGAGYGPPPMMPGGMAGPQSVVATSPKLPLARRADLGEIHVLELKHAQPSAMSQHVKAFFPDATIAVDEATGSLVIRCDKPTLEAIQKLAEKLDKPAKQPPLPVFDLG